MFVNRVPRPVLATLLWLALLVWAVGIVWLSSLTSDKLPTTAFLMWDKSNHLAAFAVGGWIAVSALRTSRPEARALPSIAAAIILVAAFGAFDEFRQLLTPGRSGADFYDWIADFLGAVAGVILSVFTHARLERLVPRP